MTRHQVNICFPRLQTAFIFISFTNLNDSSVTKIETEIKLIVLWLKAGSYI